MATSDAEASDFERIDDPAEYNQRRRLKSIQDTRERVFEQRRHALDLESRGHIPESLSRTIVREAVEDYVMEVEQLVKRAENRLGTDDDTNTAWYWEQTNLGAVYLPDHGSHRVLNGLQEFLDFPSPYEAHWLEEADPPPGFSRHPDADEDGVVEMHATVQLPQDVSMAAFRTVNQFLAASGLDANPKKTLPEYGFRELEDFEIEELEEAGVHVDHG